MGLTIIGGLGFLGCQAWEWTTLIGKEHMSVTTNPFGTHTESGIYLDAEGKESSEVFAAGTTYLLHKATSVSYTYLDVYKRQSLYCVNSSVVSF